MNAQTHNISSSHLLGCLSNVAVLGTKNKISHNVGHSVLVCIRNNIVVVKRTLKSFMSPIFSYVYPFLHVLLHYENYTAFFIRLLSWDVPSAKTLAQFTMKECLRNSGFIQNSVIKNRIRTFHRIRQWRCSSRNVPIFDFQDQAGIP